MNRERVGRIALLASAAFAVATFAAEPRLGVGMECLDRGLWDHVPAMPHLKELGIKRVRLQSGWARTEKEKGKYDYAWFDQILDDLSVIGVEAWVSLSYGNPLYAVPEEGRQNPGGQNMFPMRSEEGKAAWLAYVSATVERYKERVRIWEVWNEPDCSAFLSVPEGGNWEEEYARLVRVTAERIRSIQPNARIAACTAGGPCGGERRSAALFEQGIADCVNIYSFHSYQPIPERMTPQVASAFYSAVRRHAPDIVFWRGEAGISSIKSGMGALSDLPLSEEMQARWMSRHLVHDLADPNLAFTSWFHLAAFEHFSHTRTYHYGVLREKDYSHKTSFDVLKRIRQFFDDGHCVPDASVSLVLGVSSHGPADCQTLVSDATVYPFKRNGLPLFAVTSSWPAHEAMEPVKVGSSLFAGDSSGSWRDPVLYDLLDGSVKRLQPSPDGRRVHFELVNHIRIVTEASALTPYVKLPPRKKPVAAPPAKAGQVHHE